MDRTKKRRIIELKDQVRRLKQRPRHAHSTKTKITNNFVNVTVLAGQ